MRPPRARGSLSNPQSRFDRLRYAADDDVLAERAADDARSDPRTVLLRDPSRSIVATNDSPDVAFSASVNPYRGCEHACAYCYARPTHEYLGFSAGLDFETRILVKEKAAALLRVKLASPRWEPKVLALSGVTDPYQPAERRLRITRSCLDVLAEFRNPVAIITKNGMVARDIDPLGELAAHDAAVVNVSVTTLDTQLQHRMEPRASRPSKRLAAIEKLAEAGIPVGVMVGPVIPGLTEHEIPRILQAAADAGAGHAGHILLRLPHGVKALFEEWLAHHYPDRRAKVLNRVRAVRGGALNDPRFGTRMRGEGFFADQVHTLFDVSLRRAGLAAKGPTLSTAAFRRPGVPTQGSLFD